MNDESGELAPLLLYVTDEDTRAARLEGHVRDLGGLATVHPSHWRCARVTADAAAEAARERAPEALLVDLDDPVPLLRTLRTAGAGLPVVTVVRSAGPAREAVLAAGADEYLPDDELTPLLLERTLRLCQGHQELLTNLEYLAQRDLLTGLPNQKLFERQLEHALDGADRHGRCIAVVRLVLDGFPSLLGRHTQAAAETLLRAVARRLAGTLRRSDMVARGRDEEFLLMLECSEDLVDLAVTADKVRRALKARLELDGETLQPTCSMGIAVFPRSGRQAAVLLDAARDGLRRVREAGGDDFRLHDEETASLSRRRLQMERALPGAPARAELKLLYQPRLDLHHDRISGAEVLLRWPSPDFGEVSPDIFIPVAEATGAIGRIGDWVLRRALEEIGPLLQAGHDLRLGVNVSPVQFQVAGFADRVRALLEQSRLPASLLELELTERVFVEDLESLGETFATLTDYGVGLAVDDFGVGYSSMSWLKHLPVHTLKIDQTFVRPLPDSLDDAAITRAIVALGHALGLRVVAEGVETAEQLAFLRAAGCDEAQGYHIGRPCAAGDLKALLAG